MPKNKKILTISLFCSLLTFSTINFSANAMEYIAAPVPETSKDELKELEKTSEEIKKIIKIYKNKIEGLKQKIEKFKEDITPNKAMKNKNNIESTPTGNFISNEKFSYEENFIKDVKNEFEKYKKAIQPILEINEPTKMNLKDIIEIIDPKYTENFSNENYHYYITEEDKEDLNNYIYDLEDMLLITDSSFSNYKDICNEKKTITTIDKKMVKEYENVILCLNDCLHEYLIKLPEAINLKECDLIVYIKNQNRFKGSTKTYYSDFAKNCVIQLYKNKKQYLTSKESFSYITNMLIMKFLSPYSSKNNNININEFIDILKNIGLIENETEIRNISFDKEAEKIIKEFFENFCKLKIKIEYYEIKPKIILDYLQEIKSKQYIVLKKYNEIIELITKYHKELDVENKRIIKRSINNKTYEFKDQINNLKSYLFEPKKNGSTYYDMLAEKLLEKNFIKKMSNIRIVTHDMLNNVLITMTYIKNTTKKLQNRLKHILKNYEVDEKKDNEIIKTNEIKIENVEFHLKNIDLMLKTMEINIKKINENENSGKEIDTYFSNSLLTNYSMLPKNIFLTENNELDIDYFIDILKLDEIIENNEKVKYEIPPSQKKEIKDLLIILKTPYERIKNYLEELYKLHRKSGAKIKKEINKINDVKLMEYNLIKQPKNIDIDYDNLNTYGIDPKIITIFQGYINTLRNNINFPRNIKNNFNIFNDDFNELHTIANLIKIKNNDNIFLNEEKVIKKLKELKILPNEKYYLNNENEKKLTNTINKLKIFFDEIKKIEINDNTIEEYKKMLENAKKELETEIEKKGENKDSNILKKLNFFENLICLTKYKDAYEKEKIGINFPLFIKNLYNNKMLKIEDEKDLDIINNRIGVIINNFSQSSLEKYLEENLKFLDKMKQKYSNKLNNLNKNNIENKNNQKIKEINKKTTNIFLDSITSEVTKNLDNINELIKKLPKENKNLQNTDLNPIIKEYIKIKEILDNYNDENNEFSEEKFVNALINAMRLENKDNEKFILKEGQRENIKNTFKNFETRINKIKNKLIEKFGENIITKKIEDIKNGRFEENNNIIINNHEEAAPILDFKNEIIEENKIQIDKQNEKNAVEDDFDSILKDIENAKNIKEIDKLKDMFEKIKKENEELKKENEELKKENNNLREKNKNLEKKRKKK